MMAIRNPLTAHGNRQPRGPVVVRHHVTPADYFAMPETTVPYNLIAGELYMSPSPLWRHQEVVLEIASALRDFARTSGGVAFVAPMDCELPGGSVLQPDAGYISPERAGVVGDHINGPPDLVVEVLSRSTRRFDRGQKLDAYRRGGVREAWLVDPDAGTVTVFQNSGGAWVDERSLASANRSRPRSSPSAPPGWSRPTT